MRPRLLIAGAGYLGEAVAARAVADQSHEVFLLRRRPMPFSGTTTIAADLLNPDAMRHLPPVHSVLYCAAADAFTDDSYRAIYLDGLQHLIAALHLHNERPRIVLVSSTSVYAENGGGIVDEDSAALVTAGPSRYIVQGENRLLSSVDDAVVLRLGGIYGPGRTSFLRRVQEDRERIFTPGGLYTNRIHRDDAAGIILHLLRQPLSHRIYNGVDTDSADRNEVIRWLTAALGRDPAMLKETGDLSDIAHRGNKRVRNARLLASGYSFIFPSYREGYAALIGDQL